MKDSDCRCIIFGSTEDWQIMTTFFDQANWTKTSVPGRMSRKETERVGSGIFTYMSRIPNYPCLQMSNDGGIMVEFDAFAPKTLNVRANRYDSGGANPELMLEEIDKVTTGVGDFRVALSLKGIWWSKDRRESSEHCLRVLSGLFGRGCVGLQDILYLPNNDLDDAFFEECFRLLEGHVCSLEYINLDGNRITTEGALGLIGALQKRQTIDDRLPELKLRQNPIDDCQQVQKAAAAAGIVCEVDGPWTEENGRTALKDKNAWSNYFAGPAKFLRTKILEKGGKMPVAECPICNCILAHNPSRTHSTVHNRLYSHLCGEPHRKALSRHLESEQDLPLILIVSPTWSFTFHPLTGELNCFEKSASPVPAIPKADPNEYYTVELHPDAPDPKLIQALSSEGRTLLAIRQEPELAYEILTAYSEECKNVGDGDSEKEPSNETQLERRQESLWPRPPKWTRMTLRVNDVEYTQAKISPIFQDGRSFEDLIQDLDTWKVIPCEHPKMYLEAVRYKGQIYSNNNRRLRCLKDHQEKWEECWWQVWVAAKVHNFEENAFETGVIKRFWERINERLAKKVPPHQIGVRQGSQRASN